MHLIVLDNPSKIDGTNMMRDQAERQSKGHKKEVGRYKEVILIGNVNQANCFETGNKQMARESSILAGV
jgi:hypothetical protein